MKLKIVNKYGQAPNELLNDPKLSFKSKGIYTYIQSKPDGWDFSAERIADDGKDGRESVLAGLKELEDAGYLVRTKAKLDNGQWDYEYTLYGYPSTEKPESGKPESGNPTLENPSTGKPSTEKPTDNKERISKQEVVIKTTKKEIAGSDPRNSDVQEMWDTGLSLGFSDSKQKMNRYAIARMIKKHGKENLLAYARFSQNIRTMPYSPQVRNWMDLEDKLVKLRDFAERHKNNSQKTVEIKI